MPPGATDTVTEKLVVETFSKMVEQQHTRLRRKQRAQREAGAWMDGTVHVSFGGVLI